MPPQQQVANANVAPPPDRAILFSAECEAVASMKVAVLDEKQPERDWRRWSQAVEDSLRTRPYFAAELQFGGAIAAVGAINAGALQQNDPTVVFNAAPTLQQQRQLAIRALINNSLLEGGDARKLIENMPYAGGAVNGNVQAKAARVAGTVNGVNVYQW